MRHGDVQMGVQIFFVMFVPMHMLSAVFVVVSVGMTMMVMAVAMIVAGRFAPTAVRNPGAECNEGDCRHE